MGKKEAYISINLTCLVYLLFFFCNVLAKLNRCRLLFTFFSIKKSHSNVNKKFNKSQRGYVNLSKIPNGICKLIKIHTLDTVIPLLSQIE